MGGEGAEGRPGWLSSQPASMPSVLGGIQAVLMDTDKCFPGLAGMSTD